MGFHQSLSVFQICEQIITHYAFLAAFLEAAFLGAAFFTDFLGAAFAADFFGAAFLADFLGAAFAAAFLGAAFAAAFLGAAFLAAFFATVLTSIKVELQWRPAEAYRALKSQDHHHPGCTSTHNVVNTV